MIDIRCRPALAMRSSRPACSGVTAARRSRWTSPRMAFIGVRISWLMLARKALLARLASSAAALASSTARSASLRAAMLEENAISRGFIAVSRWS
jgi:hypothetical protein